MGSNPDPATTPEIASATTTLQDALELQAAEELRRAKEPEAALALLEKLSARSPSARAGVTLARCLRELGRHDEARDRLSELVAAFPSDADIEAELGWLRYEVELKPLLERGLVAVAALRARELVASCADDRVRRAVMFALIRAAKARKQWEVMDAACDLIDPSVLSDRPTRKNPDGWSDRARWNAAKGAALLQTGRTSLALELAERAARAHTRHRGVFRRMQGKALALLGRLDEAHSLYQELCRGARPSQAWWLHQELAQLEWQQGHLDRALGRLCRAALGCRKIEMGVQLLADLAACALEAGEKHLAAWTADLALQVRQQQGWRVPSELIETLTGAGPLEACSQRDRLEGCRKRWRQHTGEGEEASNPPPIPESPLQGVLLHPDPKRPFCFIQAEKDRYFCLAADLPDGAADGARVSFRLVPSFDRKKQKSSVRATEIAIQGAEVAS